MMSYLPGKKVKKMLTKEQIAKIAYQNHVSLGIQERDYLEHLLLFLLYTKTQAFIFKGGTALRVAYNFNRYSEDLDFNSQLPANEIKALLTDTVNDYLGLFGITAEFRRIKIFKENGERSLTGEVSYQGPLYVGKPAGKGKVRIDVSLRGEKVKTQKVVINHKYDDINQFILSVLTLEEIFAEKVRALMVRGKPRDLYDVWVLLGAKVKVDKARINQKLKLYQKEFDVEEFIYQIKKTKEAWEQDLQGLLPQLVSYNEVKKAVLDAFA